MPSPPGGVSRIDTLPVDFISSISRRPRFAGDVIANRYRLVEALGDGAMGQVFIAENLSMGRKVAIKLLKPELLADASFRKRFQREAMAIAAIEHRNVARFVDLVVGDPTFLVMEFVPGPTLAKVLKEEKQLDPPRAVELARRLCWALDAVHSAAVIHRDIKPSNVILTPDPELGEEPKLIDFGLAKLAFAGAEEQLTRHGQFVGTPHYMAPEQIASGDVDARSDVYSLGCLLYHMVAGRPPFGGIDDVQVLYQQMEQEPTPVRQLRPEAPLALEMVLRCALAKDPAKRFASMRAMVEALAKIERAPAPSVEAPPPPRPRSRWLPAIALAAVAAGATALMAGMRPRGLLVLTTLPPGARVTLDGKTLADATPAALPGLAAGEHRLRFELDGRSAVERSIKLGAGERASVDAVLPVESRAIEIKSIPSGATVLLDGVSPGETPMTLSIPDDDFHELRVEKLGYVPETQSIKPEERGPIVLSLTADKQARGLVWVDSKAAGEVFLDGKNTGYAAPTVGIRVAAGSHTVEVRDSAGNRSRSANVIVRSGESIHVNLEPAELAK